MLSLQIPKFEGKDELHRNLVAAAERAEDIAIGVNLLGKRGRPMHFVRARRAIREALRDDGVAGEIDRMVADLLGVGVPVGG